MERYQALAVLSCSTIQPACTACGTVRAALQVWQLARGRWLPPGLMRFGQTAKPPSTWRAAAVKCMQTVTQHRALWETAASTWPASVLVSLGLRFRLMCNLLSSVLNLRDRSARSGGPLLSTVLLGHREACQEPRGSLQSLAGTLRRFVYLARLFRSELDVCELDPAAELGAWVIWLSGKRVADGVAPPAHAPDALQEGVVPEAVGAVDVLRSLRTVRWAPTVSALRARVCIVL